MSGSAPRIFETVVLMPDRDAMIEAAAGALRPYIDVRGASLTLGAEVAGDMGRLRAA